MQTPIRTLLVVDCGCGREVPVDASGKHHGSVLCECGGTVRCSESEPDVLDVLKVFGISIELDYDDQLIAESEQELSKQVIDWIAVNQTDIRRSLIRQRDKNLECFVGGPMGGKQHNLYGMTEFVHISRAHWAIYKRKKRDDPRLYYVGKATSKAKAKRGDYERIDPSKDH